jgi:hypothetical protein
MKPFDVAITFASRPPLGSRIEHRYIHRIIEKLGGSSRIELILYVFTQHDRGN